MAIIEPFEQHYIEYEAWFERNRFTYQSELAAVKEFIPDNKRGIEIGLGSGKFAAPLGIKIGVEPSPKMREIAKNHGLEVFNAVAEALPFSDGSFDFVLMVTTICFVDDIRLAFKESYRILKHSGLLIVGFIDKNSFIGRLYERNKQKSVFYRQAHFYYTDEVISYLKEENFRKFDILQTIFHDSSEINRVEPIRRGYGEGSFVVIKSMK